MSELTDFEKAAIYYDALHHYYIKKTKEEICTPLEMPLEELLIYALDI
jgi:hypothetical protein